MRIFKEYLAMNSTQRLIYILLGMLAIFLFTSIIIGVWGLVTGHGSKIWMV